MLNTLTNTDIALKSKLFRGFADPSRLAILEALRSGPLSVTQIICATGLNQPNTSNHLACLRDCGLVSTRQSGRQVFYELSDQRVILLLEYSEGLLADVAQGMHLCPRYSQDTE